MKTKIRTKIQFVVDPDLIDSDHSELLIRVLQEEKIKFKVKSVELEDLEPSLFFIQKKNLKKVSRFKNKIIALPTYERSDNQSVSVVNFNSYEDIVHYIKKIFRAERHLQIQDRLDESERMYEVGKLNLEKLDSNGLDLEHKRIFESLLELEMLLLQEESIENWNIHFDSFTKDNPEFLCIILLKSEKLIDEDYIVNKNVLIYKIPIEDYYLYIKINNFNEKKYTETIDLLLTICVRTIQILDQKLVKSTGEIDFWKQVFSKIPYPMAIITSLGDLLIHNESFAKIGILPKECLRFKDFENAEIFQNYYKVRRIDFPLELQQISYFIFYTSEKKQVEIKYSEKIPKKQANIDDLGIISSSIAHELNNPLAGILAALSLLSLEDDWDQDALSDLEDMKSGAKRCKELVEIFLGFSKFSPSANSKVSIRASLDQAINLLRFRMIESNLRIDIKYLATLENFSHQINASIMSMILYLIFSELMTAFAHHRLVTMSGPSVLSGEVLEFSNQIVLKLNDEFEYEEKIAQSKLIQHLLIFEKLETNFLKQEIRLIYRI